VADGVVVDEDELVELEEEGEGCGGEGGGGGGRGREDYEEFLDVEENTDLYSVPRISSGRGGGQGKVVAGKGPKDKNVKKKLNAYYRFVTHERR